MIRRKKKKMTFRKKWLESEDVWIKEKRMRNEWYKWSINDLNGSMNISESDIKQIRYTRIKRSSKRPSTQRLDTSLQENY